MGKLIILMTSGGLRDGDGTVSDHRPPPTSARQGRFTILKLNSSVETTFDLNRVPKGPTVDRILTIEHLLPVRLVFNVLAPVSHVAQLLVLQTPSNN